MCIAFSRLRDDMILVAHASLVKPTRSSRPTPLWTHMYKAWQKLGVIIDIGKISGQNLTAAVDHIIRFTKPKKTPDDVSKAVSPSSQFFNEYQLSLVGALNDTTELPQSEASDAESVDAPSTCQGDSSEEDDEEGMPNFQSAQQVPNTMLYDEDLLTNHFMFVQIPNACRMWRAFSCRKSDDYLNSILNEESTASTNIFRHCV